MPGDHHHFGLLQDLVLMQSSQQLVQMYFKSVYKRLTAALSRSWAQIASKKNLLGLCADVTGFGQSQP